MKHAPPNNSNINDDMDRSAEAAATSQPSAQTTRPSSCREPTTTDGNSNNGSIPPSTNSTALNNAAGNAQYVASSERATAQWLAKQDVLKIDGHNTTPKIDESEEGLANKQTTAAATRRTSQVALKEEQRESSTSSGHFSLPRLDRSRRNDEDADVKVKAASATQKAPTNRLSAHSRHELKAVFLESSVDNSGATASRNQSKPESLSESGKRRAPGLEHFLKLESRTAALLIWTTFLVTWQGLLRPKHPTFVPAFDCTQGMRRQMNRIHHRQPK